MALVHYLCLDVIRGNCALLVLIDLSVTFYAIDATLGQSLVTKCNSLDLKPPSIHPSTTWMAHGPLSCFLGGCDGNDKFRNNPPTFIDSLT